MARGMLVFKGEDAKKKKKKSKHSKKRDNEPVTATATASDDNGPDTQPSASYAASQGTQSNAPSTKPAAPKMSKGTGEITTSGTVVTGYGTKFEKEISMGDAIIVMVQGQQQEMRVVTMRLSNVSLNLSSGFSENLKNPTSFSIIRKPRDEAKQRRLQQKKEEISKKEEEEKAAGTFGSTEELVYRERTEHGNYRIKREKVEGKGVSRGDLLEIRAKKTSDKYC